MTLLNGLLAFGALAFTIPLAIHLLFRSRLRSIDWGAMHLLSDVLRANHRRIRVLQLLLLLLRCLIPILLAFCLARPVFTRLTSADDAPRSVVLVIDDSLSMSAEYEEGLTRLAHARQMLGNVLAELNRQDEVMIVVGSQVDAAPSVSGVANAARRLRQLTAESGPVGLAALVRGGVAAAEQAMHSRPDVLVVTDFQTNMLGTAEIESLKSLVAERDSEKALQIGLLDVRAGETSPANVSADGIDIESPAVIIASPTQLRALLRNESDDSVNGLTVRWHAQEQPIGEMAIDIPARSNVTVKTEHEFASSGSQSIEVTIEHADSLPADNRREILVDVIEEVVVLVVDGQPDPIALHSESDFLVAALEPFSFAGDNKAEPIRTVVTTNLPNEAVIAQVKPNVLVLANVPGPTNEEKSTIADFVLAGGSLVMFDGSAVEPQTYNETWRGSAGDMVLPARLGDFVGPQDATKMLDVTGARTEFPAWAGLVSSDHSLLDKVDLIGYRELIPGTDAANEDNVILQTGSGQPVAVSGNRGQGRIVQWAIPCDTDWSNLPLGEVFVPMMQQLMLELAGSQRPVQNLGLPASESNLESAPAQRIIAAADVLGSELYTSAQQWAADLDAERSGREVWPYLLLMLLAVMVAEIVLQQRLSRPGTTANNPPTWRPGTAI